MYIYIHSTIYTTIYKIDKQGPPLLYRELSSISYNVKESEIYMHVSMYK